MPNEIKTIQNPGEFIEVVQNNLSDMQKEAGLKIPDHYSVKNALTSAMLVLRDTKDRYKHPVLDTCSRASIQNALLNMVLQGLNPAMNQCYFIAYGDQLQMQRSYFGTVTALLRLPNIKKVQAQVVHKGDEFEIGANDEFETVVAKFVPKIENQDAEIVDAFAVITLSDGSKSYTIMTKKEIDQSWSQTRQKENRVQRDFAQEMAKRTVLNRAAKMFINTADDSQMIAGAISQTTKNEYRDEPKDVTPDNKKQAEQAKLLAAKVTGQEVKEDHDDSNEKEDPEEADGQTDIYDFIDSAAKADGQ